MALTVTVNLKEHWGRKRVVFATLAFDSSYPTGGESLTAANLGLQKIDQLFAVGGGAGYHFDYDLTNSKLLAYYSDLNAAGDGPDIQVPDTTDLSTPLAAVRVMAIGH